MGAESTKFQELSSNEVLARFVSPESLSPSHPFWNSMLSFRTRSPKRHKEWMELEKSTEELLARFTKNNLKTANLASLIDIFLTHKDELKSSIETDNSLFIWQTFNSLLVIRVCVKYFKERLNEDEIMHQFDPNESNDSRHEELLLGLVDIIVGLPLNDTTYGLKCEAISF